jgi:hypothetical protein
LHVKINFTFNDSNILKKIEQKFNKNILYNDSDNKIQFITKKIDYIDINSNYNILYNITSKCDLNTFIIDKKPLVKINNNFNVFTNCDDGKFHNWNYINNDLICSLCNKSYNELLKNNKNKIDKDTLFLDKLKIINLQKLALKYCITGELHNYDTSGKCLNCGLYINNINLNNNQLLTFDKNLNTKYNESYTEYINNTKQFNNKILNQQTIDINNIDELNKLFEKNTNNNIELYISNFINKLTKILSNKIKIKDTLFYLDETLYTINHDYLGLPLKNNITILSSENKIIIKHDHPLFSFSILYYKSKNIYVYYDLVTLQYLGYSEDNKTLKTTKNYASLNIELSLKDCLLYLGYENKYYNLYHINKDFVLNIDSLVSNETIIHIIRNRINNLRQIITRAYSIIYSIKYSANIVNKSAIISEEKNIIYEFKNRIKNIKTDNIFTNKDIINKLSINNNIPNIKLTLSKHYIDLKYIVNLINTDTKLLFYFIHNLIQLIDNNIHITIQTELCYLIIKIIKYLFNFYYRPYENYNIRKFDYQLINDTPNIDDSLKINEYYQELVTVDELNNPDTINDIYDSIEAKDSLDIDDYEQNEDLDDYMEALDGFEP